MNFLRWLFKAEGVAAERCKEDWALLVGMGSGAEKGVEAAGLTYEDAVAACDVVSEHVWAASGASYGLDDLVCFLCLSQSREAVGSNILPPPAAPVTVASDLGDAGSGAQAPRRRRRFSSKTAAAAGAAPDGEVLRGKRRGPLPAASSSAGSGAASGASSCPRARSGASSCPRARWRASLLRPSSANALVPWARVLTPRGDDTRILQTIMDELPLRDQVALSRTSKDQREKCISTARAWGLERWTDVMALVAETLRTDAPVWEEHTAAGVCLGSLFRAAASVWDTVDRLNKCRLPAADDLELLLALALARWGVKLQLKASEMQAFAHELSEGGRLHRLGGGEVECRIAKALGQL